VWLINPAYVRFFARALGQQAKSDPIDATILALFGISPQRKPPRLWSPPPPIHTTLQQLLNEREDMAALSTRTLNRLHALKERPDGLTAGYARLRELQATTVQHIKAIETEIQTTLAQDPAWATSVDCLRTVKGIGLLTAVWLTTLTVNFTAFQTPEELTSFIGLAPYVRQSGTTLNRNRATGQTGNPQMRKLLYLAAQNAKRYNPTIKAFYDRLLARGKKKQVATVAATRKLLHLAWALGTKQQRYDPAYRYHPRAR
jgi:transposase